MKIFNSLYNFIFQKYILKNHYIPASINNFSSSRCFLVISNTALGDTLLSTPAIKSLKESFPNSKIIALINHKFSPLFENYKYIDKVINFYGGYNKFFTTIKKIKQHKPEMALIFHGNGPQDIQITVMSGCKYILKHPTKTKLKKHLSYDFAKKEQHTIEDRLDLVRKINGKHIYTTMSLPDLTNQNLLRKYQEYNNYIGFQIGAADVYKMWGIDNFIKLAKKIKQYNPAINILITGNKTERNLAKSINKEVNIINTCGELSIKELPYLINSLKLLITNDTGTMHLAIALHTPTISLFSPTTAKGIGPYQDMDLHKIIQKDGSYIQKLPKKKRSNEAMQLISVDEVFEKYLEFIK